MRASRWAWTAGRLVFAAFCWLTAVYAFVSSSAFSYLQFIKPRVFPWVGLVSDWHPVASVVALTVLVAVLWPDLRRPIRPVRTLARAGLVLVAACVAGNLAWPVLWSLSDGTLSLVVGVLALLPLLWLAALDLLQGLHYLRAQRSPGNEPEHQRVEGRALAASIAASFALSVLYAAFAAAEIGGRFEPDLLLTGQALGFAASFVYHAATFVSLFLVSALLIRVASGRFLLQYALISLAIVALLGAAFARIVGDALSLHGWTAWLAALATALSIAGTWTGLKLRRLAADEARAESPMDLYFGAPRGSWLVRCALVIVFAYVATRVSNRVDWDFVLLDSSVLIVWLASFALAYQRTPVRSSAHGWLVAIACAVPLAASLALSSSESMGITLERYAVYNPSFRVAETVLGGNGEGVSSFDRYLRAHTGLTDVSVAPIDIDFVENLGPAKGPKPLIFLFVIDSLRPDYLAPYNPAVRFTPRIGEFAAESVVFTNAITRYGGTGLSVPAMWAGSAIIHKQYVTPFHPMNSLEKLLDANHYKRLIGLDSIMGQLLQPSSESDELDRGRPVMDYEFCRTLDELASKLPADSRTPVFAYSLPQDVHMSRLPRTVESGPEYDGFHAPYATKVHAIDGCFGQFIDTLKARRLYDDSLIVLTADHGEMLGEDGRFGHSYHLFPQTVRVPLIMHLPARIGRDLLDPDAVSLTTDIVPTIYDALGYRPAASNDLMGRSLISSRDDVISRRRDAYVIAASYGAVYAVASHNGRRLYVADAVRGGDLAFEQDPSEKWTSVKVTPGLRAVNQFAIRRYVDELSRLYELPDVRN